MKLIFKAKGLPVGPFVVVRDRDWALAGEAASASAAVPAERKRVLDAIGDWAGRSSSSPARGGSSMGPGARAAGLAGLREAIEAARRYDRVKDAGGAGHPGPGSRVRHRWKASAGAARRRPARAAMVDESGEEFFDFEASTWTPSTTWSIPAPIPARAPGAVRRLAAAAFEAVPGRGAPARVADFFYPRTASPARQIDAVPG